MTKKNVSFPRFGNYNIVIEVLLREGLGCNYIEGPPTTKKTLELGTKYSPEFVCTPFKYQLGGFIEAIEAGADTLIQVGGPCRLGYYGELHEQILKDLGYTDITFVNMAEADFAKPITFYNEFKKINPKLNIKKVTSSVLMSVKMLDVLDRVENFIRENVGFEVNDGEFDIVHKEFLDKLRKVKTKKNVKALEKEVIKRLKDIKVKKPKNPLRVGFVGEYYTIMDPYSNHFMEKELAKKGIVIERWMNLYNSFFNAPRDEIINSIKGYAKYDMGATSMYTIKNALEYAKDNLDGIVHVKSFGCTPEIDAMPILQKISKDFKIPILYFSFDSQTSDVGIQTRLEAFYDMMVMRKEK